MIKFPLTGKGGYTALIFTKEKVEDPRSYRQVSVTSVLGKIAGQI